MSPELCESDGFSTTHKTYKATTTAPTIFNSGVKDNIIPLSASATINFRIISGETIATVLDRVNKIINDERIIIKLGEFISEPSKVSSTSSFGYKTLHKTISEIYPTALVAPYLVVGATDSRHFNDISDNNKFENLLKKARKKSLMIAKLFEVKLGKIISSKNCQNIFN